MTPAGEVHRAAALDAGPRRLRLFGRGSGEPTSDAAGDGGRLAMQLFLAALGMLFAAALVGHVVIRLRLTQWPPSGSPPLPDGLWLATAILALVSGSLVAAERAVRRSRHRQLGRWTWLALGGGIGFLLVQVWNWSVLAQGVAAGGQNMFTATYWVLTVLHGLHVLGGLPPLALVAARAPSGRYHAGRVQPVLNVAWYWHFLGVTWLAIVAALAI